MDRYIKSYLRKLNLKHLHFNITYINWIVVGAAEVVDLAAIDCYHL